jgi:ribonuclease P protein component
MPKQFTLGKEERIKSRKRIEYLFREGKRFSIGSFRVHYHFTAGKPLIQVGTGTSTKLFRKAVDRNRIKRLIRESWRLQKNSLKDIGSLEVFIIYTGKLVPQYNEVFEKTGQIIEKLKSVVNKKD